MPYVIEAFSIKAFIFLILFASVDQFFRFLSAVELPKMWQPLPQANNQVYCYPYRLTTECFVCHECEDAELLVMDSEGFALPE